MASPRTSSISSSAPTARRSRWILSRLFERKPPRKSSKSRYGRGVCDRSVAADAFAAGEAARAEAATKGKKAVVAALKAVKASK